MKFKIFILVVILTLIIGCGDRETGEEHSLPTRGNLVIGIDESLRPVIDAEIATFSVFYPDARIETLYLPEKQVVEKLLANELQAGIICRDLYKEESDFLKSRYNHIATTFKLADDAIVAVLNNSNPLKAISYDDVKKILSGKIADWGQLNPALKDKSPIVVVITGASSINRFFSSLNDASSTISAYALDTTTEVIDYVKSNPSAIGIVGGSWFYQKGSDYSVKMISLKEENPDAGGTKTNLYREVYAVNHEPFTGLGAGFISFLANQKGQIILEKAGMTPYKPITREIQIIHYIPE